MKMRYYGFRMPEHSLLNDRNTLSENLPCGSGEKMWKHNGSTEYAKHSGQPFKNTMKRVCKVSLNRFDGFSVLIYISLVCMVG